jgi:hypothetical protein
MDNKTLERIRQLLKTGSEEPRFQGSEGKKLGSKESRVQGVEGKGQGAKVLRVKNRIQGVEVSRSQGFKSFFISTVR